MTSSLTPDGPSSPITSAQEDGTSGSPTSQAAGQRVAAQMLAAFLTESLLPASHISAAEAQGGWLRISIHTGNRDVCYQVLARKSFAYGRWFVDETSLRRRASGMDTICEDPSLLLSDVASLLSVEAASLSRFADEIARTFKNHSAALEHSRALGEGLAEQPYDRAEAQMTDGHRYHPSFKSRIGFSPRDNAFYGPEFANALRPVWLAVHQDLAASGAIGQAEGQDRRLLADSSGVVVPDGFHGLPVHPWQWNRILGPATVSERTAGRIVVLGEGTATYLAQQSIRTLVNADMPHSPSLKLSLSIRNSSTVRTLAPHTVLNAPVISGWLDTIRASDPYLRTTGTVLLLERMGTTVSLPSDGDPTSHTNGAMAAIWRDPIHRHLRVAERASPFAMLTHLDPDGMPAISPWLAARGLEPWTQALLRAAMLPVVHFLLAHGVALESHQQNMVLIHRDGWPLRVALKDFHDGVRFIPQMLSGPRPALVATPAAHARINPNSYVEASETDDVRDFMFDALFGVNLAELAAFLHRHFDYDERRFWHLARSLILEHLDSHPQAGAGAERFGLFEPLVAVEDLARRRVATGPVPPRWVPNPLVAIEPDASWNDR